MSRLGKIFWSGVLLLIAIFALLSILSAQPAAAQPGVVSQDVGVCDPWFPKNCSAPLGRVSAGTNEFGVSIATSTAPTIPSGTLAILVMGVGTNNASGQCLMWRDDGTAPTGTVGNPLPANVPFWYFIKTSATSSLVNSALRLIAATGATCAANFSYYK